MDLSNRTIIIAVLAIVVIMIIFKQDCRPEYRAAAPAARPRRNIMRGVIVDVGEQAELQQASDITTSRTVITDQPYNLERNYDRSFEGVGDTF